MLQILRYALSVCFSFHTQCMQAGRILEPRTRCPSVRPSHSWTALKPTNVSSNLFIANHPIIYAVCGTLQHKTYLLWNINMNSANTDDLE